MAITTVTLNTVVYGLASNVGNAIKWTAAGVSGFLTSISRLSFNQNGFFSAGSKSSVVRQVYKLEMPIVVAVDSDCACAGELKYTLAGTVEVLLPSLSTTAERTDFGLRMKDLLANAAVQAGFISGQPPV